MGYTQTEFMTMFLALFAILVLGVIFRFTLRKAPLSKRQLPLTILGATILVLELMKQGYHLIVGDWRVWFLPLHFCSFFLLWYAVAIFTRGKVRQLMYFCSIVGGVMVSILLFVAPHMVIHEAAADVWATFDSFHTFFFHMGVVAYWVWLLMLNIYQPERQHIRQAIMIYTFFFFFIIAGAYIFHENFTNVLSSDLPWIENVRLTAGQFVYNMALLGFGIGCIAFVAFCTYLTMNSKLYQYLQKDAVQTKN